ncbi:MAG: 3-phosphoshikimate 1-carboxyvinyltransferase [Acidimicrobiales bacterium]
MSRLTVTGGRPLHGRLRVPGDKSISHRALLLAAVAEGTSVVRGLSDGDDVARTAAAIQALGAVVNGVRIRGGRGLLREPDGVIDVGNSGTTIRLLSGLAAGFDWLTVLTGDASIRSRPMARVAEPLRRMGAGVDGRQGGSLPPLVVRGGDLKAIEYDLPVASAQVKAAVLLAGLSAEGETVVRERVRTRAHTEELLALAGADIRVSDGGRAVSLRRGPLHRFELDVPGDPSQAAFWLVAGCLVSGSDVVVENVYLGPARGGFLDVLARMGASVERVRGADLRAHYHGLLHATDVGPEEMPGLIDEVPVLAVAAALAEGTTTFSGIEELRVKESDRVAAIEAQLSALGARVESDTHRLVVHGSGGRLHGAYVDAGGDHRMAMALAVAALGASGETIVDGWEAVSTSYPRFEDDLRSCLG